MLISTKRTRFKLAIVFGSAIFLYAIYAAYLGMEALATACIANLMVILTSYILGETKRPSNNSKNQTTKQMESDR